MAKQMDQLVHGELQGEVETSLRGYIHLKACIYQVCHRTGMHISYRHIAPKDAVMHMLNRPEATLNLLLVSVMVHLPQI